MSYSQVCINLGQPRRASHTYQERGDHESLVVLIRMNHVNLEGVVQAETPTRARSVNYNDLCQMADGAQRLGSAES